MISKSDMEIKHSRILPNLEAIQKDKNEKWIFKTEEIVKRIINFWHTNTFMSHITWYHFILAH